MRAARSACAPATAGVLVLSVRPDGSLRAVNRVGMEAYLRSVVPSEMSAGWPFEALRAQAVAARSYAWANRHPRRSWDVWQDTRSQAYWGIPWETARTDAAVASTAHRVRTWRRAPILAMYTAANGGWTRGYPGYPYLVTRRDRFDDIGRARYREGAPARERAGEQ